MMISRRAGVSLAAIGLMAITLSGCASSGVSPASGYAEDITPIQNTPVASSSLPPLGANGQPQATDVSGLAQPAPLGQSSDPMLAQQQPGAPAPGSITPLPGADPTQVASTDSSFVTLNSVGAVPAAPGRDLTSGLSIEKMLGGWTVVSGSEQCKLNLTYTQKTGTSRYRASTPGCSLAGLSVVASWQLVGTQVQLFDENGDITASLILSGERFIGTLAGGQGIQMVG